ncbi:putative very-long-chain acyl-CoA synthetase family protein [Aspergillus steynii IBT 23096]|uniref:Very long-chain fatty acid transport protein n=1 Tax=Aspergillus steynii IBT 23096 TaxID=1392250 RepID=A0A2I2G904_9EURO|nr:putative very-long-chain acyl-CoA synthetase family protein [Aspergillus steynii IBT 23096]PLB49362.1 putative very-long-chain acyl-CoA synthetase family protein [Aspergillus steynii IBT 23096]
MALVAASVAGAATGAAYLNAKFHITKDLSTLSALRQGDRNYATAAAKGKGNVWFLFEDVARRHPDMTCIWTREALYTCRGVVTLAARYAQFFRSKGVQKGEVVAFYLQNSADFLIAWLALLSIGCAPATVNYNLTGDALVHCLKISGARLFLVDEDEGCQARVEECKTKIDELGMERVTVDATLAQTLSSFPATVPEKGKLARNMAGEYPAILLYTSGTTGMPKACAFTMARLYSGLTYRRGSINDRTGPGGDRWYSCMPLYHGTSAIAMMVSLVTGVSVALGKRFSVRHFWQDIHDSESTVFVYVGEVARYLLAAPPSPLDRDHRVRCMYGNGLRPDIWEKFRQRFGVAEVGEFFNSTEGVFGLFNHNRGPFSAGSVGHHGLLLRLLLRNVYVPVAIDPYTGDVLRDEKTGFAERPSHETGGEILVNIPNEEAFQGYWKNQDATKKKYLRDVFRKGDLYYRSGDALRRQSDGRWYFLDRLGDTFRWKSENVATAEVAEVLGHYPGIQEANVYGVLVPHHEGRAGCAALQISPEAKSKFDYRDLASYARARLPKYAVPVFLRIVENPSHIHNHKQNKVPLREEGVDPEKTGQKAPEGAEDQFYWLPPGEAEYREFRKGDWGGLVDGKARL